MEARQEIGTDAGGHSPLNAIITPRRPLDTILTWIAIPLLLSAFVAGMNLIFIASKRLWTGTWSYLTRGDALARVGWHASPKLAQWPFSLIVLLLGFVFLGLMNDLDSTSAPTAQPVVSKDRKPMQKPKWFWPRELRGETTALVRLGRALHWFTVVVALIELGSALVIGFDSILSERTPADSYFGMAALVGSVIALIIALLGRGARYILADE
jgi:hypothetical protein